MPDNNSILILGGGFAGLAIAHELLASKCNVILMTSSSVQTIKHPALQWISGNYADQEVLRRALSRCRTIVHAASGTTPGVSARTPLEEVFSNFQPSLELIQILQEFPDRQVIYLSSGGAIYGNPEKLPVKEDLFCRPISYYGAGKLAMESFFKVVNHQCGCPVTILRPSNFYGPGQREKEGFGLIFHLLSRARTGQDIKIWGDGSIVRDYLYMKDFVDACLRVILLDTVLEGVKIYNVGSAMGHSIMDVVKIVEEVVGTELVKQYLPARPVDVQKIILDCQLIKGELGWQAGTSLYDGIKNTWQWVRGQ